MGATQSSNGDESNALPLDGGRQKIPVNIKRRVYQLKTVTIPYDHLRMIRVLQAEFNHEVKGTLYVDHNYNFVSFEIRTTGSETESEGASDWRISFHTHPANTAKKYGIGYFSPPSVDDVLEIYDHNIAYIPDTSKAGFGELSIIFTNEGIYVLQANRESFAKFNTEDLPIEGLEAILQGTFTEFLVTELKRGMSKISSDIDFDNPHISIEQFTRIIKELCVKVSDSYGFDMTFYSWPELTEKGLVLKVYDYFLNKKVND